MFLGNWNTDKDVYSSFQTDINPNNNILFAAYEYIYYSGNAIVIFERDSKLYEVHGSHCSCNGLEGQWNEEDTTWEAIATRDPDDFFSSWSPEAHHAYSEFRSKGAWNQVIDNI